MAPIGGPLHARTAAATLENFDPDPLGYHTVAVGESLLSIAGLWYGPHRTGLYTLIVEANLLISASVFVGQQLTIPRAGWRMF